ncbi:MAG TPA: membrane protein insertion efficiency factor YidD [Candidatus Subteraquimicrobiales bacterium]
MTRTVLWMIKGYRRHISGFYPSVCRHYPSCSQYAYEAIEKYGPFKGTFLFLKRLLRCHPFSPGGYDPVK